MLTTHAAAARRTPRSNSPPRTTTPHRRRPLPTSPSRTSVTSSPLARPPSLTPNAHHAPFPNYLRTITPRRVTRSPGKTRKRRAICDSFKPLSTRPIHLLPSAPAVPNTAVTPPRKRHMAPRPPFHTRLRPQSAILCRTRHLLDRCHRGRILTARRTDPNPSTSSHHGDTQPLRRRRHPNTRRRV
jgi:hypothetical protein